VLQKNVFFAKSKMKSYRINKIISLVFAVVFVWPLFYQGVHALTDHHARTDCGSFCSHHNDDEQEDEHETCPVCIFHYAVFTQVQTEFVQFSTFSYFNPEIEKPEITHTPVCCFNFQLRAPPTIFV
jgi:hypothetical protein